jgi:hypothetical protein
MTAGTSISKRFISPSPCLAQLAPSWTQAMHITYWVNTQSLLRDGRAARVSRSWDKAKRLVPAGAADVRLLSLKNAGANTE